jgi:uncharacterized protein YkwD
LKTTIIILFITLTIFAFGNNPKGEAKLNTAANASYLSPIEKEIVFEINLFRSNPAKYANDYIAPLAKYYQKKILHYPNDESIKTREGVKALNECVRELQSATPQPIMYPNQALTKSANDHQKDQGKTGKTGHTGNDNSDLKQRIERYAKWQVRIAENIAYGNSSARQVIIFLLIDDGVKNRGHRKNLLHPAYKTVGVSFGNHPVYGTMCVMDFAGGIKQE